MRPPFLMDTQQNKIVRQQWNEVLAALQQGGFWNFVESSEYLYGKIRDERESLIEVAQILQEALVPAEKRRAAPTKQAIERARLKVERVKQRLTMTLAHVNNMTENARQRCQQTNAHEYSALNHFMDSLPVVEGSPMDDPEKNRLRAVEALVNAFVNKYGNDKERTISVERERQYRLLAEGVLAVMRPSYRVYNPEDVHEQKMLAKKKAAEAQAKYVAEHKAALAAKKKALQEKIDAQVAAKKAAAEQKEGDPVGISPGTGGDSVHAEPGGGHTHHGSTISYVVTDETGNSADQQWHVLIPPLTTGEGVNIHSGVVQPEGVEKEEG